MESKLAERRNKCLHIFGMRVRKLREDKQLSQRALSEICGTSVSSVASWEQARAIAHIDILVILSTYFDVSIDWLLGNDIMEQKKPNNTPMIDQIIVKLKCLTEDQMETVLRLIKAVFPKIF